MNVYELMVLADQTGDPQLYRQAAAEWRALDMPLTAELCDRKAEHYEGLLHDVRHD